MNGDGYDDVIVGAIYDDNNGSAVVFEGECPSPPSTWYADTDGDGYGDASSSTDACWAPTGYVSDSNDCDDDDDTVYPTATETTGDGVDSDCDGSGGPDDDDDGLLDGEDDDPLTPAEAGGNGYEGDDPKGCGCASSNPSPVGGLAGLLVVGLALVRRRPTREVLSCRSGPRGATHAAVTGL